MRGGCWLVLLLALPVWRPVMAARPLTRQEQAVINFGFATQLGSGVYSVSGRTLQVYNLPFGYTLPAPDDAKVRFRLTLPVTIGIADFKPIDVVESGLPEGLDSLSFVPGIEVQIAVSERWQLEPFIEAGVARDLSNDLDQNVYAGGLRSAYALERRDTRWELSQELLHVVVEEDATNVRDDCTRLRLGATARRSLDGQFAGRQIDYLVYGVVDLYTDTPAGPASGEDDEGGSGAQVELGVTFGTVETWRIWHMPVPRIGLGYRFGKDLSAFRLVLGSAF